jgi:hypothetical protein
MGGMIRKTARCVLAMLLGLLPLTGAAQNLPNERHTVLAALRVLYGNPLNGKSEFAATPGYVVRPVFSQRNVLVRIEVELRSGSITPLSRSAWDSILATLNTIKPLGDFEEELPLYVSGGRSQTEQHYQHGYIAVVETIQRPPASVQSAHIYYLHPVTGIPRIPKDSKPHDAVPFNFYLVCVAEEAYIATEPEFRKIWSKPRVDQTVLLAGPTENRCLIN